MSNVVYFLDPVLQAKFCDHEISVLAEIQERKNKGENEYGEKEYEETRENHRSSNLFDVKYISIRKRDFFRCNSEDKKITIVI